MFAGITTLAGWNDIGLSMRTAFTERQNMILRQALHLAATIHTTMAIMGLHCLPLGFRKVVDRCMEESRTTPLACAAGHVWMLALICTFAVTYGLVIGKAIATAVLQPVLTTFLVVRAPIGELLGRGWFPLCAAFGVYGVRLLAVALASLADDLFAVGIITGTLSAPDSCMLFGPRGAALCSQALAIVFVPRFAALTAFVEVCIGHVAFLHRWLKILNLYCTRLFVTYSTLFEVADGLV